MKQRVNHISAVIDAAPCVFSTKAVESHYGSTCFLVLQDQGAFAIFAHKFAQHDLKRNMIIGQMLLRCCNRKGNRQLNDHYYSTTHDRRIA
jgi:hypothetical protein